MDSHALLRRAFPYLVIGIGGFALAYVVIFVFVLPSKIVPPKKQPYVPDSSGILRPIDTSVVHLPADTGFPQTVVPMGMPITPPPDEGPSTVPDLVGMALSDARAVLNSYRLSASVQRDTSSFQPPNTVLRQSPAPDERIAARGTVSLTVSYFPPDSSAGFAQPSVPSSHPVAPPGSTSTDSVRTIPRRPLPRIVPMDTAPAPAPVPRPTPQRTDTGAAASARFPG